MGAELIFAVGAVPLALLAWRAGRTYLLTRRISDLVVVEGIVWLTAAQFGLLNFTMMSGAWWAAHGLEVAGIGMVAIPCARPRHASRSAAGQRSPGRDLGEYDEAFLGGRVRAQLVRSARRTRRPRATLAGWRRSRSRSASVWACPRAGSASAFAVGGLLHDVGKLSVPNEILNKPGRLTDAEFDEIRRHPGAGRELLAELEALATRARPRARVITSGSMPAAIPIAWRPGPRPRGPHPHRRRRLRRAHRRSRVREAWPGERGGRAARRRNRPRVRPPSALPRFARSSRPSDPRSARRRRAASWTPHRSATRRARCSAKRPRCGVSR